jgi:dATP/dGTP diphosphohydrolase
VSAVLVCVGCGLTNALESSVRRRSEDPHGLPRCNDCARQEARMNHHCEVEGCFVRTPEPFCLLHTPEKDDRPSDFPSPGSAWPHEEAPSSPAIASDAPITTANPKDAVGSSKAPMSTVSAAVSAEVGVAMLEGALKYGRHNYRVAPIRASVYFDAVARHMRSWWEEGQDIDPASGMHHVTKAITTLFVLRDSMITGQWDDDRPPPVPAGFFDELDKRAAELVSKNPEPKRAVRADGK